MMNESKYKALFIKESKERLEDISHLLLDLERGEGEKDPNLLDNLFRGFHSIKGMASSIGLEEVSRVSHELEELLKLNRDKIRSGKRSGLSFSKEIIDLLIEGEAGLESMIRSVEKGNEPYQQGLSSLMMRIEGLCRKDTHPDLSSTLREEDQSFEPSFSKDEAEGDLEGIDKRHVEKHLKLPPTIKVDASILDDYINLIGELVSSRSRLMDISRGSFHYQFKDELHSMGSILKELYQQVVTERLLPFDNIALGLTRLVRDLSKEKAREVDLSIKGSNVKLDRAIIEKALEPLIHILRNAIDHGIEGTEERKLLRKPKKGSIEVKVSREKNGVAIQVSDDGRGIDPLKIKNRAVSMGLISRHKADRLSREDILFLTFLPGFTTAEKVTRISGRGVGMDVVKTFTDEVGGSLKISSEIGRGTNITMILPLTISIINTLLVILHPDVFALPLLMVEKVMELGKDEIKKGATSCYFSMGKRDIPVLSLRRILKMPLPIEKRNTLNLVLIDVKDRSLGLIVDDLIGEKELYVKPLKSPLDRIKGISGYTLMNEGKPVFLLDINNLLGGVLPLLLRH